MIERLEIRKGAPSGCGKDFWCWNGSVTFHLQIQTFEASSRIQRVLREKREVNAGYRLSLSTFQASFLFLLFLSVGSSF
jgi:hypothetical protein